MTDQVQHLIDRIRKEAVEAADRQGQELLAQARAQAGEILAQAKSKASEIVTQAERKASTAVERGTQSLRQAARDVLLQLGERFEQMIHDLLTHASMQALSPAVIEDMLVRLAEGFARNGLNEGQVELIVGPQDRERLLAFAMQELRGKLEQGLQVVIDPRLKRGFRLSYSGGSIRHDFSGEAVGEALAALLRPELGRIVMAAALDHDVGARVP